MENNVFCQSKKKNKPGNLTVIQNPSKSTGKTTFSAPRKEGAREGNAGAPRADPRNLPNALWKSLEKQWFSHVREGGTWLIQRAPFGRHGKSYGYSKSFGKHWKNMVSRPCLLISWHVRQGTCPEISIYRPEPSNPKKRNRPSRTH